MSQLEAEKDVGVSLKEALCEHFNKLGKYNLHE